MVVCKVSNLAHLNGNTASVDTSLAYAEGLDKKDHLAKWRSEFAISDPELIYVDGNSLGRLPKRTVQVVQASDFHGSNIQDVSGHVFRCSCVPDLQLNFSSLEIVLAHLQQSQLILNDSPFLGCS
jgi:hypothetical protein